MSEQSQKSELPLPATAARLGLNWRQAFDAVLSGRLRASTRKRPMGGLHRQHRRVRGEDHGRSCREGDRRRIDLTDTTGAGLK
jgi:hypothetical protein